MKILIVSSYLPYPLYSGGNIRLYNLIKELSKHHQITLVCEKRLYQTEEDIQEVKKFCKDVFVIDRKKQWAMDTIIKTGFSTFPFLLTGHTLPEMKKVIKHLLLEYTFDVIHVETFYVMQNLPRTHLPIVLVEHNIEYLVYQRYAQQASSIIRPLLLFDIKKIKYWEKKVWKQATYIVAVSEEEKALIKKENVAVVPNGVNIEKFKMQNAKSKLDKKEKKILFIGNFKWIQNRDAAQWLIQDIWPVLRGRIEKEYPKLMVKLWIVGKDIPDSLKNLSSDTRIVFDENAPSDTEKIYADSFLLLAPIRVGGGTSYKILEAMASGVPVITTPLGIEGISAKANKEVVIATTTEDFVDKTIELITNKNIYEEISERARILITEKYDWKIIVKKLEEVYKDAKSL